MVLYLKLSSNLVTDELQLTWQLLLKPILEPSLIIVYLQGSIMIQLAITCSTRLHAMHVKDMIWQNNVYSAFCAGSCDMAKQQFSISVVTKIRYSARKTGSQMRGRSTLFCQITAVKTIQTNSVSDA